MNAVVREKKKFENGLDDSVAGGLNAGTDVLMNQACHSRANEVESHSV